MDVMDVLGVFIMFSLPGPPFLFVRLEVEVTSPTGHKRA